MTCVDIQILDSNQQQSLAISASLEGWFEITVMATDCGLERFSMSDFHEWSTLTVIPTAPQHCLHAIKEPTQFVSAKRPTGESNVPGCLIAVELPVGTRGGTPDQVK